MSGSRRSSPAPSPGQIASPAVTGRRFGRLETSWPPPGKGRTRAVEERGLVIVHGCGVARPSRMMHGPLEVTKFHRSQRGEPLGPRPPCEDIAQVVVSRVHDPERGMSRRSTRSPFAAFQMQLPQLAPGLPPLRKVGTGVEQPVLPRFRFQVGERERRVQPLVRREPQLQCPSLMEDRLVAETVQSRLASKQVGRPAIVGMLGRAEAKERKIVGPRPDRIAEVPDPGPRRYLDLRPEGNEFLMHWEAPPVAVARVDALGSREALGWVDVAPGPLVRAANAARPLSPRLFQVRPPPTDQHFIDIERDAEVDVARQQGKSLVSGGVIAEGLDADRVDVNSDLPRASNGLIGRAGVDQDDQIRLIRRSRPALDVVLLVPGDRVNGDPRPLSSLPS